MKRTIKWLPIVVIEGYLLFVLLLYIFGPWDFKTVNPLETYCLLISYQLAIFLGYFIAMECVFPKHPRSYSTRFSIVKLVEFFTIISIIFGFIILARELGLKTFSITEIYERFIVGLHNPAKVYRMKHGLQVDNIFLGRFGTLLVLLWSPLSYSIIPLNCLLFNKFKWYWKIIVLFNIFLSVIRYIAIGTNKGIFDIAIFVISAYFISLFQKVNKSTKKIKWAQVVIWFFVILIPALLFFNKAIGSRGIGTAWKLPGYALGGQVYLDPNSFIFKYFPDGLIGFFVLLSGYLCQGYYGFSMTTALSWTPMFGLGNSMFLVEQLHLEQLTYQYKVQEQFGWDARVQWHSIYSWLANDVGIYGIIIIMFLLGFIIAVLYKESIIFDNPLAELLFSFFLIVIFFIPANNQIVQGMVSFSSFWFALFIWFLCKNYSFSICINKLKL